MPPITLPNIGLQLPVRGVPGQGTWGDTIDADITLLDAHDHTSGHGLAITPAAININQDLTFGNSWAPTHLHRVQFSTVAVGDFSGGTKNLSLFVSDGTGGLSANELYYRTSAGNNIKFTSGSSLNVAAFVGGIVGDYSSVGAQLAYDDSAKRYTFKEGTGDSLGWAHLMTGGVRLSPFNTTSSLFVEHAVDPAIATQYTMTWPAALPGAAGTLIQADNTGVITYGNTGLAATTFTGLVTASAGVTAAANQHMTVSGTGMFKHGTRTLIIPVTTPQAPGLATAALAIGTPSTGASVGIPLAPGKRITAVRAVIADSATGPTKLAVKLASSVAGSALSTIGTSSASAGDGTVQTIVLNSLTTTLASGSVYYVLIAGTTGAAACTLYSVEVDYDQP